MMKEQYFSKISSFEHNFIMFSGADPSTLEYISNSNWLTMKITANLVPPGSPLVNFSASYASFTESNELLNIIILPVKCDFTQNFGTTEPCQRPDLETECTTVDRCIYNELLCDGVDACGDNTDESEEPPANCEATGTDSSAGETTARWLIRSYGLHIVNSSMNLPYI